MLLPRSIQFQKRSKQPNRISRVQPVENLKAERLAGLGCFSYFCCHSSDSIPLVSWLCYNSHSTASLTLAAILLYCCQCCASESFVCSSYSCCHSASLVSVLCYRSVSAVSLTILLSFCSTGVCVVLQERLGCSSYSYCHFAPLVSVVCYRSVSAVPLTLAVIHFYSTGVCVVLQERLGCSSYSCCHFAPLVSVLCYRSVSAVPLTLTVILLHWCLCCATGASRLFLLLLLSFCSTGVCVVLQERLGCSSYSCCHFAPLVSVLCYRSVSAVPLTLAVTLLHWCLWCATGASRLFFLLLLSFISTPLVSVVCYRSVSAVPLTLTVILLHWCLCCATGASRLFLLLLLSFCSPGVCVVLQEHLGCSSYSCCHFAPLVSVLCYRSVSAVPLTLAVILLHWCLCCATGASRLFLLLLLSLCSTGVCGVLQERLGCSSYSCCHSTPLVSVLCYRSVSAVPLTLAVIHFYSTGVCVVLQERLGCSSYSYCHFAPLVSVVCYRSVSAVLLTLAVILRHWCLCCATGASRLFLLLLLSLCSTGVCGVLQERLGCSSYSCCHSFLLHWCLCCATGASRLFLLPLLSFCSTGVCVVLQERLGCSSYSYCHFAPLVSVLCYRSVSAVPLTFAVILLHWCLCCATGASRLFLLPLLSFCSTGVCVVLQERLGCSSYSCCHFAPLVSVVCYRSVSAVLLTLAVIHFYSTGVCGVLQKRLGCSSYSYCHFAPLVSVLCYRSVSAVPLTLTVILLPWCLCCATGASRLFLLLLLSFYSTGVCVVLQERLGCSSYSCYHFASLLFVVCFRSVSAVPLTLTVILLHWCLCCATGASRLFLLLLLSFCSTGVCVVLQEHLGCSSYSCCHSAPLVSVLCYRRVLSAPLTLAVILLHWCLCCATGASRLFL
ncbi:hypothetical protein RRG08_032241 [Elysia crispata]|uniref:Uncharacterized protein n=1 Tax=Elysia crispata TaxID=231223 RepID=A0AAE1B096_9GAST|nr:hypothetical protein RRG08_032241 [Elysia crispata]